MNTGQEGDACFTVHKFRTVTEHFWSSLQESQVWFSPLQQLNDPYDCQIDLIRAFKVAHGENDAGLDPGRPVAAHIMQRASTCGVFSVCSGEIIGSRERLMWSHYGGNHAGVCLTYVIPDSIASQLIGTAPVRYGEESLIEAIRQVDFRRRIDFQAAQPVLTAYLTTKAREWEYESESRLIAFAPGSVTFERSWLRQVCFGLRTPLDVRSKITQGLKDFGYADCKLAEVFHAETGVFDLGIREVG